MEGKLIKKGGHFFLQIDHYQLSTSQKNSIIANTFIKPIGDVFQLSFENCENIERGYNLDELAENFAKNSSIYPSAQDDTEYGFKFGFQKALEILGSKKYSEEDVTKIVMHVLNELVLVDKFDKKYLFPETI